jgi:hypothetical protein
MKTTSLVITAALLFVLSSSCFSQDSLASQMSFPSGISVQASTGYLAMKDEHISKERYSGSVSGFALQWSRYHETYGFRIGMFYQKASPIRNFTISADLAQGGFSFVSLYPAGTLNLFGIRGVVSLGPSSEIFLYYRRQNIAQNPNDGLELYQSGGWLFSFGGRGELEVPFSAVFQAEAAMQLGLLSLGGGTGNTSGSTTGLRLLTVFTGMRGGTELGVRYYPFNFISLRAGYSFEILRIDSWNYVLEATDNVFASLEYHF